MKNSSSIIEHTPINGCVCQWTLGLPSSAQPGGMESRDGISASWGLIVGAGLVPGPPFPSGQGCAGVKRGLRSRKGALTSAFPEDVRLSAPRREPEQLRGQQAVLGGAPALRTLPRLWGHGRRRPRLQQRAGARRPRAGGQSHHGAAHLPRGS